MLPPATVIIMTKLPEPGRVKTRLLPDLTPQQAAEVHRVMLLHVVRRVAGMKPAALVVCYDPPDKQQAIRALLPDITVRFLPQSAGDLGARLAAAKAAADIRRPTLFLGVDSPDLPADHLHQAVYLCGQADVVLGPTHDGGYWCLGLAPTVDADALLANIDWSSGREANQTIAAARRMGLTIALADQWDDIDRIDDLQRLADRLRHATDSGDAHLWRRLRTILEDNDND